MKIKPLNESHKQKIKELFHYCFFTDTWPLDSEKWEKMFAITDLSKSLGYFVNDELVSTLIVIDFQLFIREVLMNVGGIAGVTTQPEFRRQGQITALTIEALKQMRENKQYVSALYPFKYGFYRRYGYEIFGETRVVKANPSNIILPKDFHPLKISELSREESFEKVKAIRAKVGRKYNLVIYSDLLRWKFECFRDRDKLFVVEDGDEIVGYFIARLKKLPSGEWHTSLDLYEVIAEREDVRLTILDYIKKHADQTTEFRWPTMGDERIFDYFNELWDDDLKIETYGAAMFRVVDVEKALEKLEFPKQLDFSFSIKIEDEFAPWNEERMLVEIKNGRAKARRENNSEACADLETDIKAFTQLFVGFRTIEDLVIAYKAKVNPEVQGHITKAFPKRTTRLTTDF